MSTIADDARSFTTAHGGEVIDAVLELEARSHRPHPSPLSFRAHTPVQRPAHQRYPQEPHQTTGYGPSLPPPSHTHEQRVGTPGPPSGPLPPIPGYSAPPRPRSKQPIPMSMPNTQYTYTSSLQRIWLLVPCRQEAHNHEFIDVDRRKVQASSRRLRHCILNQEASNSNTPPNDNDANNTSGTHSTVAQTDISLTLSNCNRGYSCVILESIIQSWRSCRHVRVLPEMDDFEELRQLSLALVDYGASMSLFEGFARRVKGMLFEQDYVYRPERSRAWALIAVVFNWSDVFGRTVMDIVGLGEEGGMVGEDEGVEMMVEEGHEGDDNGNGGDGGWWRIGRVRGRRGRDLPVDIAVLRGIVPPSEHESIKLSARTWLFDVYCDLLSNTDTHKLGRSLKETFERYGYPMTSPRPNATAVFAGSGSGGGGGGSSSSTAGSIGSNAALATFFSQRSTVSLYRILLVFMGPGPRQQSYHASSSSSSYTSQSQSQAHGSQQPSAHHHHHTGQKRTKVRVGTSMAKMFNFSRQCNNTPGILRTMVDQWYQVMFKELVNNRDGVRERFNEVGGILWGAGVEVRARNVSELGSEGGSLLAVGSGANSVAVNGTVGGSSSGHRRERSRSDSLSSGSRGGVGAGGNEYVVSGATSGGQAQSSGHENGGERVGNGQFVMSPMSYQNGGGSRVQGNGRGNEVMGRRYM